METKIAQTKGDTFIKTINFSEEDNITPIDITGSTIIFSIKKKITDSTFIIQENATLTDPANWKAEINISKDIMDIDTGDYFYDIQWTDLAGIVKTVMKGSFTITYDVT